MLSLESVIVIGPSLWMAYFNIDSLKYKYSDDGLKEYIKDIYAEYGIKIETNDIFLTPNPLNMG